METSKGPRIIEVKQNCLILYLIYLFYLILYRFSKIKEIPRSFLC